ncbi:MAG: OsmC family protein [Actinobacteria bacterium]|nr:OsmC family protein [Actinomycetota bacterium]MCL5888259.1 OsmC family protein [Actinomycetota bacterium]
MDFVKVRWTDKRQFVAWDSPGHTVVMDATQEFGGEGAGMRPLQVLLAGLAGCSGMDVISILEKKRQQVSGLEVHVNARQREDDFPRIYEWVELEFRVTGIDVSEEAVRRAIELSMEKYCSVSGMLGPQVSLETRFTVLDAAESPIDTDG